MKNKISVTEEDLFKFVFYRDELPEEKLIYLVENKQLFAEELDFLKSFEQNINKGKAGNSNAPSSVIHLKKDATTRIFNSSRVKLVAASETMTKDIETATFNDEGHNYIIRQVADKDKNQLFLFPKVEDKSQKISITLFPPKLKYSVNKIATTIDLPLDVSVNEILVTEE
jgi:hypothetical protein